MEGEFGRAGHGLENRWYSRGMGIVISALRHYSIDLYGVLAQLVEHLLCKQDVRSSSLLHSTMFDPKYRDTPGLSYLAATSCEGVTLYVMHMCG